MLKEPRQHRPGSEGFAEEKCCPEESTRSLQACTNDISRVQNGISGSKETLFDNRPEQKPKSLLPLGSVVWP